jgi:hypothetical protein
MHPDFELERAIVERAKAGDTSAMIAYSILRLNSDLCFGPDQNRENAKPGVLEFIGMQLRDGVQVSISGKLDPES